jgi:hypothetical protein
MYVKYGHTKFSPFILKVILGICQIGTCKLDQIPRSIYEKLLYVHHV